MKTKFLFPIGYVSGQTGLSPHVIRVWERRYRAVNPERTDTNRRLYSETDIKRLQLLKKAVEQGHTISMVARLDADALIRSVNRSKTGSSIPDPLQPANQRSPKVSHFRNLALASIVNLDAAGLETALSEASVHLTRPELIKDLVVPLCTQMGDLWKKGDLKIVNEHLATPVIRAFLWGMLRSTETVQLAPKIVIATPLGQPHELGALTIAIIASESGWRPVYFGPGLPAVEIVAAVRYTEANAVALSLTHRSNPHRLKIEFEKLRDFLSDDITIFVGGQAAADFAGFCRSIDLTLLRDIDSFRRALETQTD